MAVQGQRQVQAAKRSDLVLHDKYMLALTPMGPYDLILVFFAVFRNLPEYLTMLWIVKAGSPMEATVWKIALCAMTVL